MTILSVCDNSDILSIIRVIKVVVTLIRIVVPIILIFSLSINYLKAVKSNDSDLISKANKSAVPKIIAALLVFYIPTFVNILADISSYDSNSYISCINNANSEYISKLVVTEAKLYVEAARQSLKRADYVVALSKVNKIKDNTSKEKYLKELKDIEEKIIAKEEAARQERENRQRASNIAEGVSGNIANILGVVYYNQCDSRWKDIQYDTGGGPNHTPATVCSSACGYTSFAMIAAGLNNNMSINPYTVIKHMRNISDGELTHRGYGAASFSEIAGNSKLAKYNLKAERISGSNVESALRSGKPVVALVPGHYVALSISSAGNIVLLDPFTGWADKRKKSGEFRSVKDIESIYGNISSAAAYSRR